MLLVNLHNIYKYYEGDKIIAGVSLKLHQGEKVGLIGANGTGKTTLLKIIMGIEEPDEGEVSNSKGVSLAYLSQKMQLLPQVTLEEYLRSAVRDIFALKDELLKLEEEMSLPSIKRDKNLSTSLMERYGKILLLFELKGGYTLEKRIRSIAQGLGFNEASLSRNLSGFSGGEKTRVQLATIILQDPELLLLDEPTNYLDADALEWLENYLRDWAGTLLLVSHDRYFLNKVVNRILVLEDGEAKSYQGNYTDYINQSQLEKVSEEKAYKKQQVVLKKETDFIRTATADARTKRQAQSREKRLKNMSLIAAPKKDSTIKLNFGFGGRSGKIVLVLDKVSKSFGEKKVFTDVSFKIYWGDRVALIGPNGAGKTTLLRIIAGEEAPSRGSFKVGASVKAVYFSQEQEQLSMESTPLQTIMETSAMKETEVRTYLGRYLFRGEEVFKKIKSLSGGEKSRLALAKMAIEKGNLLILDEPTSHLDIKGIEELEAALSEYPGTLLLVSHDRYFISRIADKIIEIREGRAKWYKTGYQEYVEARARQETEEEGALKKARSSDADKALRRRRREVEKEERQKTLLLRREERNIKNALAELEKEIQKEERRVSTLEEQLAAPDVCNDFIKAQQLAKEFHAARETVKSRYLTWEKLFYELETLKR